LCYAFAVKCEDQKNSEEQTDIMGMLAYSGDRETMWWAPSDNEVAHIALVTLDEGESFNHLFANQTCSTCIEASSTIFREGWLCTQVTCPDLSRDSSGKLLRLHTISPRSSSLAFHLASLPKSSPLLLPERHEQAQLTDDKAENTKILRNYWKGWVCDGRKTMNRRRHFANLACECGESFLSSPPRVRLDQVAGKQFLRLNERSKTLCKAIDGDIVELVQTKFTGKFAIYTWEVGSEARVTCLYPRGAAHGGCGGNDKVCEELQEKTRSGAIPMARAVFADNSQADIFLPRHFCANFGRQYNASMNMSTTPLDKADQLINKLMKKAQTIVLETLDIEIAFNEALCLAYLPKMAIGWHNDGEVDLTYVIVSRTFGASCEMKFAMKGQYWTGKNPQPRNKRVLSWLLTIRTFVAA
jgi:2OG-Fe(II) oxygenase superfamily